ncbi:hypothetical protein KKK_02230 [Pseudomonas putida B6-2]|nr:hypothetical protein KKK_02230 [Pseudomonas putida B6-2]
MVKVAEIRGMLGGDRVSRLAMVADVLDQRIIVLTEKALPVGRTPFGDVKLLMASIAPTAIAATRIVFCKSLLLMAILSQGSPSAADLHEIAAW